jgi:hypothetical protein
MAEIYDLSAIFASRKCPVGTRVRHSTLGNGLVEGCEGFSRRVVFQRQLTTEPSDADRLLAIMDGDTAVSSTSFFVTRAVIPVNDLSSVRI